MDIWLKKQMNGMLAPLLRVAKESADFAHHFFGELEDAKRAFVLMRELYKLDFELKKRAA